MSRARRVRQTAQPPRDPRLVALAKRARRAGWTAEWRLAGAFTSWWWWLWLQANDVGVEVFVDADGTLICYANYSDHWNRPSRTPAEALRAAHAALGVAIDQAEESGLGRIETPAQDSDA